MGEYGPEDESDGGPEGREVRERRGLEDRRTDEETRYFEITRRDEGSDLGGGRSGSGGRGGEGGDGIHWGWVRGACGEMAGWKRGLGEERREGGRLNWRVGRWLVE